MSIAFILTVLAEIIFVCILYWGAKKIMVAFEAPAQFLVLLNVVFVVIVCLWVLSFIIPLGEFSHPLYIK